jgi:NAD(P)H-flavin reductase
MCSCSCGHEGHEHDHNHGHEHHADALIPVIGVVTDIRVDTPDVKTFRVTAPEGGICFEYMPGQCAMLSIPAVGEAMFSITSSPTNREFMEFSIKKCGTLTDWLHQIEPEQELTIRGPYGNGFPVDDALAGKDLLFIAGGIGLAPLRSVINYCLHHRDRYGSIDIVYGARSSSDLVDIDELKNVWPTLENTNVHLTIDREEDGWDGHVGFVPSYVKELDFSLDKTVLLCGPPIMIKFTLASLQEMGFDKTQVYTTMELKMKCGVGKCGRCNIGSKYVCKDGPVFRCDELDELPDEY